ncbi:MAG: ECF transporter S component, partial [Clostridia bacterium]|nr:ECF transporter S component [Clostridia bacterium]
MKPSSTFRIVLVALFAALTCVATMFLRIPSPTGGYLNLGDGIALLSAFLLGPWLGGV